MTLENNGKKGWQADHVRPIDSFELSEDSQIYACYNWRNYQPLWWFDNLAKGNRYDNNDEIEWIERMTDLGYVGDLHQVFK